MTTPPSPVAEPAPVRTSYANTVPRHYLTTVTRFRHSFPLFAPVHGLLKRHN